MKALRTLFLICIVALFGSCTLLMGDYQTNDNRELYNSEWSTEDESEGMKFYSDNSVLFFSQHARNSGTFTYTKSNGYIIFEGLTVYYPSYTVEIPGALLQEDGTMKVLWHELGKSENYYEILYRRR